MRNINELTEVIDFAKNAKFKITKSKTYQFFTINEKFQIRIYKNQKSYYSCITPNYSVTLHEISEDGITYNAHTKNTSSDTLSGAKIIAAQYYFETIRNN